MATTLSQLPVLPSMQSGIDHSSTPVLAHCRSLVDQVQPAGVEEAARHHIPHATPLFVHSHAWLAMTRERLGTFVRVTMTSMVDCWFRCARAQGTGRDQQRSNWEMFVQHEPLLSTIVPSAPLQPNLPSTAQPLLLSVEAVSSCVASTGSRGQEDKEM
ncbi:hypothetical protein Moror_13288 [Moniliophthora roreri MCA 2997]|uniref:Uncharacterized protein n=2 Tax=Moniliophthora roreri TaxID=221103 RepID=V2WSW9_MONRO|nr:hypothetical protein Moror_13288 [Moniliophthora roreri MCA 2997]